MTDKRLSPADLISRLTVAAVELYALDGVDAEEDAAIILEGLPLIAKANGSDFKTAEAAVELIEQQHELAAMAGNALEPPLVMDVDNLFLDPSGEEILEVADALLDVVTQLTDLAQRQSAARLLRFMLGFWEFEDCLTI